MSSFNTPQNSATTRRHFIASAGASLIGATIAAPQILRAQDTKQKLKIGLIGCGGRGKWIANLFVKHGGYDLVGLADYFSDRVKAAGDQFKVPEAQRFTGLSGYKKLLEQKLDAVAIESPPYFHAEQAAAAVDAGKHVYLAKPAAVDVPGCLSVEESGKRASANKLTFLVDFQTRANKFYQEAVQKVHAGELGKIVLAEANYHCGFTFERVDAELRKDPSNPETRLRAWGVDRILSGDIITEQNIHALDVAAWMLNAAPVKAYGTGGRTRPFHGNCWDHFACIFYYPNDILLSFNSHQSGFGYDDIMCRVYGLTGTVDTHYFGKVTVKTQEFRSDDTVQNLYQEGAANNIATFYDSVTKGDCSNATVAPSVRSNLTTILGRTAAYNNTTVTWDEMIRAREAYKIDLSGLKA